MIDEDVFRALLAEAADSAPPPGDLPADLLAALADETLVPAPRLGVAPRRVLMSAAAAVVLLVGVFAVLSDDDGSDGFTATQSSGDTATNGVELDEGLVSGGDAYVSTTMASPSAAAADGAASGGGSSAGAPVDGSKVVKTGSLTLEVARGGYDRTVERMTTKAIGLGGYVAQSSTARNDDRPSGTLMLRVPADQFDALVADLRKLGDVVSEDTTGADVTGQHADVAARLTAVKATGDRLYTVLNDAKTVGDILSVQDRITAVQTEIEQLEGQLRTIDDQVAMGTLTVSLGEPGAQRITLDEDDGGLSGAWSDARRRFSDGVEGLVSWSGSAAVVLLVALVLLLAGRLGWDRMRRFWL